MDPLAFFKLPDILIYMAVTFFALGILSFLAGVFVLVSQGFSRDVKTLAMQTSKIAQKGITDEVSGLVGNASTLLSSLNEMVRTKTGVGLFLTVVGLMLMGTAYWLILQIDWT
ncbi:MAG: hypothetical protein DWQ07_00220 [Chloroflexi bacterium]|nr:MAG: hypothetical protein DWQ07_00220 [Chloroflexota bacterium]MBL1196013.1 hypothetical protein [Chloroflexota bacterium]NOH13307.1 hypothetical protein [Chloroflexota bacterium]